MRDATVVSARLLTSDVREITIDAGSDFGFIPGQWVSVRIPSDPGKLARAYSIASVPRDDGCFEIAVTRVERGPGSNFLHTVEPGTTLRISHAQGFFVLDKMPRPLLMVATGTGVSPFRSMLLSKVQHGEGLPPTVLLFGTRTPEDLLYREDFEQLAAMQPSFRYLPTMSRADQNWGGRRGYVQAHVLECIRSLGGDCDVYICGLNEMIRDVRAVLKAHGVLGKDQIHTERYD